MARKEVQVQESREEPSSFENAIEICGFGLFNIFLLLASLPGLWSTIFETATMSYVVPAADCDLHLSLMEKGLLNAVTFAGTLISSIPWGFLAGTLSRKYILVYGLLATGTLTLLSVLSQTADQLMAFKFLSGVFLCGPIAGFVSYISEFHGMKHRTYIIIILGFINSLPLLILPIMASLILPKRSYNIGSSQICSWKIFIAITALPSLVSALLLLMFPESPKFLMAQGRNEEALHVFQIIYAVNKRMLKQSYPITELENEAPQKAQRRSTLRSRHAVKSRLKELIELFNEGASDFRLLCAKEYVNATLMVCCMQFCLVLSVNTLGLWQPQSSETEKEMRKNGYTDFSTCAILEYSLNKSRLFKSDQDDSSHKCQVVLDTTLYYDSMIIAAAICANYIIATILVKVIENNNLLRMYLVIASTSQFLKYWSTSHAVSILLASINSASGVLCVTLVINASINLYPTAIRTMTVIFLLCCARLAGVLGNILFPLLMSLHCVAMFVFYSVTYLCTFAISLFLPNTATESLK